MGSLLGYNFDPLVIVVAFIITARAFSHSVQLIVCFDDLAVGESIEPRKAAEQTMRELFRPSMLGLYADAGAILCVILTSIPLMQGCDHRRHLGHDHCRVSGSVDAGLAVLCQAPERLCTRSTSTVSCSLS